MKRHSFQEMVQRNESRYRTDTQNKKWIQNRIMNLNIKHKIIKLLENKRGENIDDLGFVHVFLDGIQKAWSVKEWIGNLEMVKMKNFCERQC